MCTRAQAHVSLVLDTKKPSGILSNTVNQSEFRILQNLLESLAQKYGFSLIFAEYQMQQIRSKNKLQFNYPYRETHCFRGYPTYGSFKQFIDSKAKYILHLDCDMMFYEDPTFSWIKEGVRVMEENEDILCVLPKGGPPTKDGSLHQATTEYKVDNKRGLYLFKNFTSRHYLIHRERFLSLLPLEPLWLSWREPIKSRLFGNGKMLCWEAMVEHVLTKSPMWRADLMTDQAWSIHPGDRSELFYRILPQILSRISKNQFPDGQRGHFDLHLEKWSHFLNQNN